MYLKILLAALLLVHGCAGCSQQSNDVEIRNDTDSPDTGVQYSYWLRLDRTEEYIQDYDGLLIKVRDFGNYLDVVVANNDNEARTFGGEYCIYRDEDGKYSEVLNDVNLISRGVNVQDMVRIKAYDMSNDTEIELNPKDNLITIEPGQKIKIEFLTLTYRIFDEPEYVGDYCLTYGDMSVDFSLVLNYIY